MKKSFLYTLALILFNACQPAEDRDSAELEDIVSVVGTFAYDLEFLENNLDNIIVLKDDSEKSQLIIAPQYQGRVMTSTAQGEEGRSFGWINYDLIKSGEVREHINPYGGEDRFWMGPEGGQYAIFFEEGDEFTFENWQTPAPLDTEAFNVVSSDNYEAIFTKEMQIANYSGTLFDVGVERKVRLLDAMDLEEALDININLEDLSFVAFASDNQITNQGEQAWTKEEGLLSIWILGMFIHSPTTTVVIPFEDDPGLDVPMVNDVYFGQVPEDRLRVEDGYIFFKGDGAYRSKIGIAPERAKPIIGSYDAENQVLTIVKFKLPVGETDYVNSMWEIQSHPYEGDAVNSYNDGPLEGGEAQLGPFYELESSSPAAALKPSASMTHTHTTVHFSGSEEALNQLSSQILGIGLSQIIEVFAE